MIEAATEQAERGSAKLLGSEAILRTMDRCTKCGLCQAYCPVATVTDRFPGPKYTGPQAQRFRTMEQIAESAPELCSGCGICSSVCPNDVAIADIITIARHAVVVEDGGLSWLQRLLNRPDRIGRLAGRFPALANQILHSRPLRLLAEILVGLDRRAPLPRVQGPIFRRWLAQQPQPRGVTVLYFTGCAVENYDGQVGIALVRVLNALGIGVAAPTAACCSLPMLSSGEWGAAAKRAASLVEALSAALDLASPIIATSTSCSLTLRLKYAAYLDRVDASSRRVANAVVDSSEYLLANHAERLRSRLGRLPLKVLYHGPCQLRGHGMGQPAVELLQMIPGVELQLSRADCCGIAGTYGYVGEKAKISRAVAQTLVDQVAQLQPDVIACDSETCRWNIQHRTGRPSRHPVELLAQSLLGDRLRSMYGIDTIIPNGLSE